MISPLLCLDRPNHNEQITFNVTLCLNGSTTMGSQCYVVLQWAPCTTMGQLILLCLNGLHESIIQNGATGRSFSLYLDCRSFPRLGNSIGHICLRRSSENYNSPSGKDTLGKFHFSFTSFSTDIHNTDADYKAS